MTVEERLSLGNRQTPGPTGKNDAADPHNKVLVPNTPGTLGGNAQQKLAEQSALKKSLNKVDRMITGGRKAGFNHAANHLEHWRRGTGTELVMPASAFENEEFIKTWLKEKVWMQFVNGTEKRLKSGQLSSGKKISMHWIDSLYAPMLTDLYFALGGFTIRSDVVVRSKVLSDGGGTIHVFDQWTCQVSDKYNWDLLKKTYIPGIGRVEDEELRILEANRYGKMFDIKSEKWSVTDPKILQPFSVSGF